MAMHCSPSSTDPSLRVQAVIWGHTSAVVAVCVNEDLVIARSHRDASTLKHACLYTYSARTRIQDIIVSGSAKNMCLIHALSSAQVLTCSASARDDAYQGALFVLVVAVYILVVIAAFQLCLAQFIRSLDLEKPEVVVAGAR